MPSANETITHPAQPRCVALVGPQSSGKTSLLESMLFACGAIPRKGLVKDGNTVGDGSAEARARQMSTEPTVVHATYLDDPWTFIDCPGSVELAYDARCVLMAVDAAIVVCEPDMDRAKALGPILRFLDENGIPHLLYVNKMDTCALQMRDLMAILQGYSSRPLVLRQVPIREGDEIRGYVDLASERAYRYNPGQPSSLIQLPETVRDREQDARREMLEHLADFDDALLEQLLEEVTPPTDAIYKDLSLDLAEDLIVPVLLGAAEREGGIRRLLKALRHEVPFPAVAADRLSVPDAEFAVQVFKTVHAPHAGKLSYARVWRGRIQDGMTIGDSRISGLYRPGAGGSEKIATAEAGMVVALGRMDAVATGHVLTPGGIAENELWPLPEPPVFHQAIRADNRNDEVKLSASLQKLSEEDPALRYGHDAETSEMILGGAGTVHLQIAVDRLASKYNVSVATTKPLVPYKETIRKGTQQHSRFKRQSGGHGQFADIHIEIKPLPRGTGHQFTQSVVGGSVPKQYIPGVEAGVGDYLKQGPFGFPVVDVAVNLTDGQYHSVDSSDMAFRTCASMAMKEGMPQCDPVLLEPIDNVTIAVPNEYTAKVQRLLSSRRGQILGFDAREGWDGWDEVKALVPRAECHDMIVELRSLTLGLANFVAAFDHLQELTGRVADQVVAERQQQLNQS